jgi:hypothetical protein
VSQSKLDRAGGIRLITYQGEQEVGFILCHVHRTLRHVHRTTRGIQDLQMTIPVGPIVCLIEGQEANMLGVILQEDQGLDEVWIARLRIIRVVDEDAFIVLALRYMDDYQVLV